MPFLRLPLLPVAQTSDGTANKIGISDVDKGPVRITSRPYPAADKTRTRTVGTLPFAPRTTGSGGNGGVGGGIPPPPITSSEPLSLASLSASINQIGRLSSAMSDSGSESSRDSNTTVGTDSTDYLSDESEEELQRLAVERAIEVERQRADEAEYESARRGLQNIELTPPQQWGTTMGGRGPSVRSTQYLSFGDMAQYGTSGRRPRCAGGGGSFHVRAGPILAGMPGSCRCD
ncbi:hypothetical protein FRC12_017504 [Ceratobasidium sp. 428]|nr:hypothetical protein FRC12_017504 [Ceratobasidium sp. 428]